jgi:hypothetical protein
MTRGRKCRMRGARAEEEGEEEEAACALVSPEWEEVRMEVGGAEAETKAIKTGNGCRNS